ncbi:MAG: ABC transporter permease [Prochloraceae cyanobacterium]
MNVRGIFAIAKNAFIQVIRDRILYFIGFFAILLVVAFRLLPELSAGQQDKMSLDVGLGAIEFLTVVVGIFVGTGIINKEIEKRTVLILIPKPIDRSDLILGKHFGLSAVLVVMVLLTAAIWMGLLAIYKIPFPIASILVSLVYLCLQLALIGSIALLFGVLTSSILATLFTFGIYLMGNSSSALVELGKISEDKSVELITQIIYLILPDLSRLNLKNEAVYGVLPDPQLLLSSAVYAIVYTILVLTITTFIFSRKEF